MTADAAEPTETATAATPAAEVALGAVTLAAVVGLARLFADASFLVPLALVAVAAHLSAALLRRSGLGLLAALPAGAAIGTVVVSLLRYPGTTWLGLPGPATVAAARADVTDAWTRFGEVVAPAPVEPGFVLAAALAVWVLAQVADWGAFRLGLGLEALVPAGVLFVFGSMLAAGPHRSTTTVLMLVAALGFLLVHRVGGATADRSWLAQDARRGRRSLLRTGAALAGLAVIAAVLVGPTLPGASDPALVTWRGFDEPPDSRVTISPLVDIQSRLVQQPNSEAFEVRADRPSYWRLTALDEFDGRIWRSEGDFSEATDDLPTRLPGDVPVDAVTQRFTISNLSALWVPAAFEARSVSAEASSEDADIRWDETSSTLIVGSGQETSDGLAYTVESALPRFSAEALAAAPAEVPDEIAANNLALPEGFSPEVRGLAQQVVADAGAASSYGRALALQDFLRSDAFSYSLDVPAGHGGDALERFLLDEVNGRVGYCEQFAGAYAAMARAVGLPSRVAVGFTPGERDPRDPDLYRVTGEQAHAWPEVFIAGSGWVPFEPTPGRGAPGAEDYTGVAPAQSVGGEAVTQPTVPPTVPGPAVPPPSTAPTTTPPPADAPLETGAAPPAPEEPGNPWPGRVLRSVLVAVSLVVAYVAVVVGARLALARRRRATATTPDARTRLAWREALGTLGRAGFRSQPAETPDELARRATSALGLDPAWMSTLATSTVTATYAARGADDTTATRAEEATTRLRSHVDERSTRRQRALRALDPRTIR